MTIHKSGEYNLTAETNQPLNVDIVQLSGEEITVNISLSQPGGVANIRAITIGQKELTARLTVNIRHISSDTTANFEGRALLRDQSHLDFRGLIDIEEKAPRTESFLTHRSLLQDTASVSPIPSLEIKNNQVKASHAAAVTKLDDEATFFLRSRGLPATEAERLLTTAFLAEIIDQLEPTWQKAIDRIIR